MKSRQHHQSGGRQQRHDGLHIHGDSHGDTSGANDVDYTVTGAATDGADAPDFSGGLAGTLNVATVKAARSSPLASTATSMSKSMKALS
ncbi:MAG: hypothetical protein R3C19_12330 [Planctomycetaceae bacterium]